MLDNVCKKSSFKVVYVDISNKFFYMFTFIQFLWEFDLKSFYLLLGLIIIIHTLQFNLPNENFSSKPQRTK